VSAADSAAPPGGATVSGPDLTHADSLEDVLDERTRALLDRRRGRRIPHRRGWLVRRALATADMAGLLLAFLLSLWLVGSRPDAGDHVGVWTELLLFVLTLPLWILLLRAYRLYDRDEERADHSTADDVFGVLNAVTLGAWGFFAAAWVTRLADPTFVKLFVFWAAAIVLVSLGRTVARAICRRRHEYVQNTLIVGAGDVGQAIARKLLQHPEYGVNLVGFVDEHPKRRRDDIGELTLVGTPADLATLVPGLDIERVIVAFSDLSSEETVALVRRLNEMDVQVDVVPRLYEVVGPQVSVHAVEGLPLVAVPRPRLPRTSLALKRALDMTMSGLGLVLLSPLFAAIAVAIKLDSPGPVFFRQVRRGRGSSTFRIVKFRTMAFDAETRKHELTDLNKHLRPGGDARMFKAADDPRVTRVGRALRRTSLDELPQLWNVLRGEMSLVGPRPLILEEDDHVEGWGAKRLDLKPGITGLWQVLGRDDIPFGEMVELDYRYVTTWSLGNDLKLMCKTLPAMARERSTY
jgi:exopolysaccharide biosynthesis polyprenyl glycosylphosphotransferase